MVRFSSSNFNETNLVTLVHGTGMFTMFGISLALHGGMCEKWRAEPYFVFGFILSILSLLGMAGIYYKKSFLICIYLLILSLFFTLVMIFIIFAFTVTRQGAGKDYKFGDYSPWLQKSIRNWDHVKNCLHSHGLCSDYEDCPLEESTSDVAQIQSGCCKPPSECNFVKQSPMVWNKPMMGSANYSKSPDCGAWDNDPNVLCFNCDSCKHGLLKDMKENLRGVAVIFVLHLIFSFMLFAMGICVFRDMRRESLNLNRVHHLVI